ncbi:MAG: response regulator transcription factor [Planctomycetota bacterium]
MSGLTPREIQVLGLIGYGFTIPQIADRLFRSPKTIESHRQALGRKLGIRNRVELARLAIREGLAPLEPDQADDEAADVPWAGVLTRYPSALRAMQRIVLSCWPAVDTAFCVGLVQRVTESLEIGGSAVWSWDPGPGELRQIAGLYRGRDLAPTRLDADSAAWRESLKHGGWSGVGPAAVDGLGRIAETNTSVQAALGVRLDNPADGAAVGGLLVFGDRPEPIGPEIEAVLRALSPRVAAEVLRIRGA